MAGTWVEWNRVEPVHHFGKQKVASLFIWEGLNKVNTDAIAENP